MLKKRYSFMHLQMEEMLIQNLVLIILKHWRLSVKKRAETLPLLLVDTSLWIEIIDGKEFIKLTI